MNGLYSSTQLPVWTLVDGALQLYRFRCLWVLYERLWFEQIMASESKNIELYEIGRWNKEGTMGNPTA